MMISELFCWGKPLADLPDSNSVVTMLIDGQMPVLKGCPMLSILPETIRKISLEQLLSSRCYLPILLFQSIFQLNCRQD